MNKIKNIICLVMATLAIAVTGLAATTMAPAYATTSANQQAQNGVNSINPEGTSTKSLPEMIKIILTAVFTVIGMVAVVMIIIGGVNYATSQGDPAKATKAKNTIMYAVIGLVITLLAIAIVNFVLSSLQG